MALKGHPKGCASNHVSTISGKSMGYADGGSVGHVKTPNNGIFGSAPVVVNTFRSDAEKKVDAIYAPGAGHYSTDRDTPTQKLNKKIDDAEGGVRG